MGARTDEAKRRVEAQRRAIEHRVVTLEQRVRTDLDEAKSGLSERIPRPQERASEATSEFADKVRERPLPYLAGALGAGVVLGIASEGTGADGHERGRRRGSEQPSRGAGLLGAMLGGLGMPESRQSSGQRGSGGRRSDDGPDLAAAAGWMTSMLAPQAARILEPAREELQSIVREAVRGFGNRRAENEQAQRDAAVVAGIPGRGRTNGHGNVPAAAEERMREAEASRH